MAGRIVGLVLEHFHGDPLAKVVFWTLADRANQDAICWPSRADISARAGVSPATVDRKLRLLASEGWIKRKARFQASAVFRINVAKLLDCADDAERSKPVPGGFEAFPEEIARKSRQAIENKDDNLCDDQDNLCDDKDNQTGGSNLPITSHKPSGKGPRPKGAVPCAGSEDAERAKRVAASRALVRRVARDRARRGQDWQDFGGQWCPASDFPAFEALQYAENGAGLKGRSHG